MCSKRLASAESESRGRTTSETCPPSSHRSATFRGYNLNQGDKNTLIGTFRNVWTPLTQNAPPNLQTSFSIGGNDPIAGHRFGYLLSGTYSLTEDQKADGSVPSPIVGRLRGQPSRSTNSPASTGGASVLWGGLFNVSTLLGTKTRLMLNNTYNRTADNDARQELVPSKMRGYVPRSIVCNTSSGACDRASSRRNTS